MKEIGYILLGWVLGLASPLILEARSRRKQRKEFTAAIAIELKELQFKLANVVYLIAARRGEINKSLLQWLRPIQEQHAQIRPSEVILDKIDVLLKASDPELAAFSHKMRQTEGARGLTVKKYEVPFIDSQIGQLSRFSPTIQQAILHVRWRLSMLNEEIDEARQWFRMTYDSSITGANYDSVRQSLENVYFQIGLQARFLADVIDQTLPLSQEKKKEGRVAAN